MVSKFLQIARPFMSLIPECVKPEREVRFNEKLAWTFGALIVYFLMATIPLYGVGSLEGQADPFFWVRTIMASQRGTLAELGIGPIVTAGLIMQILTGSKIIHVDMSNPEERALYTGTQKVLAVAMTIFEAIAYILGGAYPNAVGNMQLSLLILVQLVAAGILIILLDELVQKGWGLGSGISLFIAGGVAQGIFWNTLAPIPAVGLGNELELIGIPASALQDGTLRHGAILALIQAIQAVAAVGGNVLEAIAVLIIRPQNTPGLLSIVTTVITFLIVIYFESMRIEIPVSYAKYRGFKGKYPIKLLYVSNIPVILVSAVFADAYFVIQMLWNTSGRENAPLLIKLLGNFQAEGTRYVPLRGCLIYYLTPPQGILAVFDDFFRAIIYALVLVGLCIVFSVMWIETAGMGPRDVSRQLIGAGMQMPGWRQSQKIIEQRLARYIPPTAIIGGIFIGVLAAFADFLGALGTGTGILLAVSIMRQYFEILVKEKAADMHPALRDFLGIM
ncbi:MAG: preprotein translocase subunit SecY [Candidatus Hermodarchaeota archaeon]